MIDAHTILLAVFRILQVMVIPAAIGSTILLVVAVSNEWATRPDRRDDYVRLANAGVRLIYILLFLDLYWNAALIVRATAIGFARTDDMDSLARAAMSLFSTILGYGLCAFVALALLKFCEDGKQITDERRAEWRKRRRAQLQDYRQGRPN